MAERTWRCGSCRAKNLLALLRCEHCGWERPMARPQGGGAPAPERHRHAPDPDTGRCQCDTRFNTREQGRVLMRAVLDVAAGRRTEAEVHAVIDETFAGA